MTATLSPASRHDALLTRLTRLRSERDQALVEIAPPNSGDDADRATNIDGHIRLAMLEQRIADIEFQMMDSSETVSSGGDTVVPGSMVTVDFGDGPETYVFGSVDLAGDGIDVITPASPLGQALQGTKAGATVSYKARAGRTMKATVTAVE